jgi:hypothetical protein
MGSTPVIGVTGDDRTTIANVARRCQDRFEVVTALDPLRAAGIFRYANAIVLLRSPNSHKHVTVLNRAFIPAPILHLWIGRPRAVGVHPPIDTGLPIDLVPELLLARLRAMFAPPPAALFSHAFSRLPEVHSGLKLAVATACGGERILTTINGVAARVDAAPHSLRRWWRGVDSFGSLSFKDVVRFVALLRGLDSDGSAGASSMDIRTLRKAGTKLLGLSTDGLMSVPPAYAMRLFLERHCWKDPA